jgi:hypothetical protein
MERSWNGFWNEEKTMPVLCLCGKETQAEQTKNSVSEELFTFHWSHSMKDKSFVANINGSTAGLIAGAVAGLALGVALRLAMQMVVTASSVYPRSAEENSKIID